MPAPDLVPFAPALPPWPDLCAAYEQGLAALEGALDAAALLPVLLQRDQVGLALARAPIPPPFAQSLVELDRRLRQAAARLPAVPWEDWRQTMNPLPDRWWWRLDEGQVRAVEKRHLPWTLLTGIVMTITLGLAADIARRLWSGGPDAISVVSTALTLLLTGSPLTRQGTDLASWTLQRLRIPVRWHVMARLNAAVAAFLLVLLLRLSLPAFAVYFNNHGYALLRAGNLSAAQQEFTRAVAINPDYAVAYSNLADAYIDAGDDVRAAALFVQALNGDRNLDVAYNGLGYTMILQGKARRAIPILYRGLAVAQDDAVRAALWTNLGRAYLESLRYAEAANALAEALRLAPQEAAAYCTLGLAGEARGWTTEQVGSVWENCLRYADPTTARGQELLALAKAHVGDR